MKPSRFTYHAPRDLGEALQMLADHGDEAKVLAGGQSLLPLLNFRMASPEHLVDINFLPDLSALRRQAGGWAIPALARQREVETSDELAADVPLLKQALVQVAHPQIRNRGTVCGSLAHGDAAAELPAAMLALGATLRLAGRRGERDVPVEDFFQFHLTTAIEPDELLLEVHVGTLPAGTLTSFQEFATRRGDFGIAGVAAVVGLAESGAVTSCRLAVSGVAPTPVRLSVTEQLIVGNTLEPALIDAAGSSTRDEVSPTGDVHADAAYRRQLAGALTKRALREVTTKASLSHV
jgi:carbon-monoxide dehydrogenase medium subunit